MGIDSEAMKHKTYVIILNYFSEDDSIRCIDHVLRQKSAQFTLVIVDNSTKTASLEKIREHFTTKQYLYCAEYDRTIAEAGGVDDVEGILAGKGSHERIVLIRNGQNLGYAAGNNVGIRYALKRGADAILIVNPDLLLEDEETISAMNLTMFSRKDIFILGPRVIDRRGRDQNPLREPTFMQELLGTVCKGILRSLVKQEGGFLMKPRGDDLQVVMKVTGCCVMIRADFLERQGLLDESTFLYCEEAILAHKAREQGGYVGYLPSVQVRHLHADQPASLFHYRQFMVSRLYYLKHYKGYNKLQLLFLKGVYSSIIGMKSLRKVRQTVFA